jgi:hypothetical protein
VARHPLEGVPEGRRWLAFVALVVLTLGFGKVMGSPPKTAAAPWGIVSLEFAGSADKVERILQLWGEEGVTEAVRNTRLDYVFLLLYSTTIAAGCLWGSEAFRAGRWGRKAGEVLAWGQALAALLDATENVALLKVLRGSIEEPWPKVAFWCALPKFALIVAGIIYGIACAIVWLAGRRRED